MTAESAPIIVRLTGLPVEYDISLDGSDIVIMDTVEDRDGTDRIVDAPVEAVIIEFGEGTFRPAAELIITPIVAAADAFSVREDARLTGDLFADNGSGADEGEGLAVTGLGGGGSVGTSVELASGASVTVEAEGTFSYAQNGVYDDLAEGNTAIDSFTYALETADGQTAVGTVTITIQGDVERVAVAADAPRTTGTDEAETIEAGDELLQLAAGGGGGDVFDFSEIIGDGIRQTNYVTDYEIGVDVIDIGGAQINIERTLGERLLLSVGPDNDTLMIIGLSSSDQLEFL